MNMLSLGEAQQIASIMAEAGQKLVWPVVLRISSEYGFGSSNQLRCRVGSGKKTYHCLRRRTSNAEHEVTFGRVMVQSKYKRLDAARWRSGQEILEMGFFDGRLGIPELFAHTVLHELAHALQTKAGDRTYRSVHNQAFYKWLSRLHKDVGAQTLAYIQDEMRHRGLPLEFKVQGAENERPTAPSHIRMQLRIGEQYRINDKSGQWVGRVEKLNPKRAVVLRLEDQARMRVPYGLFELPDETPPGPAAHFLDMSHPVDIEFRGEKFLSAKHLYYWLHIEPSESGWRSKVQKAPVHADFADLLETAECPLRSEVDGPEFAYKALKRAVWEKFQNPELALKLTELPWGTIEALNAPDFPDLTNILSKMKHYLEHSQGLSQAC